MVSELPGLCDHHPVRVSAEVRVAGLSRACPSPTPPPPPTPSPIAAGAGAAQSEDAGGSWRGSGNQDGGLALDHPHPCDAGKTAPRSHPLQHSSESGHSCPSTPSCQSQGKVGLGISSLQETKAVAAPAGQSLAGRQCGLRTKSHVDPLAHSTVSGHRLGLWEQAGLGSNPALPLGGHVTSSVASSAPSEVGIVANCSEGCPGNTKRGRASKLSPALCPAGVTLNFMGSNPRKSAAQGSPGGQTPRKRTLQLQRGREVACLLHDALPGILRCLFPLSHHLELHSEGSDDGIVVIDHSVFSHHLGAVR